MATCLLPRDDLAFARKRLCLQSHRGSPGKPVPIPSTMANFEQAGRAKSHEQQEKENSGSLGPWQQPRLRAQEATCKRLTLLLSRKEREATRRRLTLLLSREEREATRKRLRLLLSRKEREATRRGLILLKKRLVKEEKQQEEMQAWSRRCWQKCSGSMAANLKSSLAQRRRASRPAPHRAQAARRRLRRPTCLRHRQSLRRRRRHRPRPRLGAGASPRGPNDVLARTSRFSLGLSLCGRQSAKKIFIVPDGAIQGVLSSGEPSRVGAQERGREGDRGRGREGV